MTTTIRYSALSKTSVQWMRDVLRDSGSLATALGLSGTSNLQNHIFAKRPRDQRVAPGQVPNFPLPRLIIDKITIGKDRITGTANDDVGIRESTGDFQISWWVNKNIWSVKH